MLEYISIQIDNLLKFIILNATTKSTDRVVEWVVADVAGEDVDEGAQFGHTLLLNNKCSDMRMEV